MSRYLYIVALVIAGEMVFGLPFNIERFFRPTMLEVFGFTNTQLGDLFVIYGITAMLSYFPGGALADRFPARNLLTASLFATSAGGLYMATIPGPVGMGWLYGFWGVTTIFLFWGALIRATREWGADSSQGAAFGLLEGGRGLVAATVAVLLAGVFAVLMPDDPRTATDAERLAGFRAVILGFTAVTVIAGVLTWFLVPHSNEVERAQRNPLRNMLLVLRRPIVWAQAAIIVCAYCGYKAVGFYVQYLYEVMDFDEVQSNRIVSYGAYVRPVAALAAGLIADRFDATRTVGALFLIMAIAYVVLGIAAPDTAGHLVIYLNLVISLVAVFALRGVYFALLQETRTPRQITGAAVGLVSVVGFTPEIFFAPIAGRILDATPGIGGFHNLFFFLAAFGAAGVAVVFCLLFLKRNNLRREPVT